MGDTKRDLDACYTRIMSRTQRQPSGCLDCNYSTGSHGYPQCWDGVTVTLAHRIVWEWHHGPIPGGMTVDHKDCHNRRCVEIAHLRLITNLHNARRNHVTRGDAAWPINGKCLHGHDDAIHWRPKVKGVRLKGYCAECRRLMRLRKKGSESDVTRPIAPR